MCADYLEQILQTKWWAIHKKLPITYLSRHFFIFLEVWQCFAIEENRSKRPWFVIKFAIAQVDSMRNIRAIFTVKPQTCEADCRWVTMFSSVIMNIEANTHLPLKSTIILIDLKWSCNFIWSSQSKICILMSKKTFLSWSHYTLEVFLKEEDPLSALE